MKNSSFKLISAIIGTIFVISLFLFISSIISGKNNNSEKADEIFNSLAYKTATAAQQNEPDGKSHSKFAADFVKAVHDNFEQFAAISLTLNDNVIYSYPPVSDFQLDPEAVIQKSQEITTLYGNTIKLAASIYKINPANIYYKARVPFFLILIGTIAAFFVLIFVPSSQEETLSANEEKDEENSWENYKNYDSSSIDSYSLKSENESSPVEVKAENIDAESDNKSFTGENEELSFENSEDEDKTIVESFYETNHEENSNYEQEENSAPQSLQEFLGEELAIENSDVSVLITKINHLIKNSELSESIQKKMIETFNNQGVLFNFNEDSYATVLVETDFETAMNQAEILRTNLIEIVEKNSFNTEITIGVSAKTSRNISAEELIYEADQAQQHTEADNPIVGLKVDPEKYNSAK